MAVTFAPAVFSSDISGCGMYHTCISHPNLAYASEPSNTYMSVSAQSEEFDNHFAGSMIVEVVIHDPAISDIGGSAGEPHVSINGDTLRMVQARNGNWYGYFADLKAAQNADQTSLDGGVHGRGLDFGVFCGSGTPSSVFGISFSDSDGVAVPRYDGLSGYANGRSSLSACGGSIQASPLINSVLRSPPSLGSSNTSPESAIIDANAWPVIQMFSLSGTVKVQYERGGSGSEHVTLQYRDISSIFHTTDRIGQPYPVRAEVLLYVNDPQLNQDPTDEDSWTFGVSPGNPSVFYNVFYGGGGAAGDSRGHANLYPHLGRLGFDDNGYLTIDTGGVIELTPNKNQPADSIYDSRGVSHDALVTLAETRPNSGVFASTDSSGSSSMRIAPDAARGTSAVITYNDRSSSVLTGSHSASLDLPAGDDGALNDRAPSITVDAAATDGWRSGVRIPITLHDADQNIRPEMRDNLSVYRHDALVPSIRIGSPLTAYGAPSVVLYETSPSAGSHTVQEPTRDNTADLTRDLEPVAVPVTIMPSDSESARLYLDIGNSESVDPDTSYGALSVKTGFSASDLYGMLVDTVSSPAAYGTNWLHMDMRSLGMAPGSGGGSIRDASVYLYFGSMSDSSPVLVAERLGSLHGMAYLAPDVVSAISSKSGAVYVVFDLGPGDGLRLDYTSAKHASSQSVLPITIDVFSFGVRGKDGINNAIYRLELEETSQNSGMFEGALEFAAANQINIDDIDFASGIIPTGNNVKFITVGRMVQEDGITITYPDLARVGVTVPQSISSKDTEVVPQSGTVSVSAPSGVLRFGIPVTVTLNDPDLNLSADTVEVYHAVDDPLLPSVDTVGRGSHTLLEIKFKNVRYERCVVDGTEYGGLASSGFALVETGPATGVFEGVFKMPTWVCNKSGSDVMSTAGGSIDVVYYDSRDSSGQPNTYSTLRSQPGADTSSDSATARGHTGTISDQKDVSVEKHADDTAISPSQSTPSDDSLPPSPLAPILPQDPSLVLDANEIALDASGTAAVMISGNVGVPTSYHVATVYLTRPDLTVQNFDLRAGADGRYGMLLTLKDGVDAIGVYTVNVTSANVQVGMASFRVVYGSADTATSSPSTDSPEISKDAESAWSDGLGPDSSVPFVLHHMLEHGVIYNDVNPIGVETAATYDMLETSYPSWLDAVVIWWSEGLISDDAFVHVVQYMIDGGLVTFTHGR